MSRNKASISGNSKKVLSDLNKGHIPNVELSVEKFIEKRDFSAAITLLEVYIYIILKIKQIAINHLYEFQWITNESSTKNLVEAVQMMRIYG